jgi:hypothetical protein
VRWMIALSEPLPVKENIYTQLSSVRWMITISESLLVKGELVCFPVKIMSYSPTLHSIWQPLLKIEISWIAYDCQYNLKFKLQLYDIE